MSGIWLANAKKQALSLPHANDESLGMKLPVIFMCSMTHFVRSLASVTMRIADDRPFHIDW